MLIPPSQPQLLKMIQQALLDQNPEQYQILQQQQQLQAWSENRAEEIREAWDEVYNQLALETLTLWKTQPSADPETYHRTQRLLLWEQTLGSFLNFQSAPSLTTDSLSVD